MIQGLARGATSSKKGPHGPPWISWQQPGTEQSNAIAFTNPQENASIQLGTYQNRLAVWQWNENTRMVVQDDGALPAGWNHVAYTYDGTTHRLYLNGEQIDTSGTPSQVGPVTIARLGTWQTTQELWKGRLDEIRIYNRPLDASEVRALAAAE